MRLLMLWLGCCTVNYSTIQNDAWPYQTLRYVAFHTLAELHHCQPAALKVCFSLRMTSLSCHDSEVHSL